MTNSKLNNRVLVVFFMILSGILLPISGIMLHSAGENGNSQQDFNAMGIHNIAALIFTISCIFHIKYNWRAIINYVREKHNNLLKHYKEMAIAVFTLCFLLLLVLLHTNHHP